MPLRKFLGWLGTRRKTQLRPDRRLTLKVQNLEARLTPAGYLAIGAGTGSAPWVAIRVDIKDAIGGDALNTLGNPPPARSDGKTDFTSQVFMPFVSNFRGGVNTATGNFDGLASTPDSLVTAAGPSGGPHVIVWNMVQRADGAIVTNGIRDQFFAFDSRFRGGVNITTGDLDGDGKAELICGAGAGGGPHVKIFKDVNGRFQLAHEFFAFDASFRGGVNLASGQGYKTTMQMRLVLNDPLPSNFRVTPYEAGDTIPGANYNIPLVGLDYRILPGGTEFIGPNQGYTVPNGVVGHLDAASRPRPYVTVGSGSVQYLSANLRNSLGQTIYRPNIFTDPNAANTNGVGEIVFATFTAQNGVFQPDFVYGPFVRLTPVTVGGTVIAERVARLTPAPNDDPNAVVFTNQLVVGAGAGGGPHVKVFDFVGTAGGRLVQVKNGVPVNGEPSKEFFAFDPNFTGGVKVAINDVIANETLGTTLTPGRIDYTQSPAQFIRDTSRNSGTQAFTSFPFDTQLFNKLKPDIIVSMQSGGSQVKYFGDRAEFAIDQSNDFSDLIPAQRNNLENLNLAAYVIDSFLAYDPNATALTGFQSTQASNSLLRAVDAAFTGGINVAAAAFRFSGSMQTSYYGFNQAFPQINAGTAGIAANPVLAQGVFGAGVTPAGQASRGSRVRVFDQAGYFTASEAEYQASDDFQAFNDGSRGANVSFGFGVLPDNSQSLDVIYANYNPNATAADAANGVDLIPYAVDTPLINPIVVL